MRVNFCTALSSCYSRTAPEHLICTLQLCVLQRVVGQPMAEAHRTGLTVYLCCVQTNDTKECSHRLDQLLVLAASKHRACVRTAVNRRDVA